ncbi:nuclease HARBI1-like protein [Aphelenchoides avenae]|nr:nuclease HARBI1-like protein [Aphelenchus avenae]
MVVSRRKVIALLLLRRRMLRRRRFGIHPINRKRRVHGEFHKLVPQLRDDPARFKEYFRLKPEQFDLLLELLHNSLLKRSQRAPLPPEERLAITLRGRVRDWCIDGNHVRIVKPANSGSIYYNYKDFCSIVLMAVCDAKYRITYMSCGHYGHKNDASIYDRSPLRRQLDNGELNIPPPEPLPGESRTPIPYFFIGDSAFPLTLDMMKPYPSAAANASLRRRVYNYRLCRARRVIENVFGMMAARWRILLGTISTNAERADDIVEATCCLHNFLIDTSPESALILADKGDDDNGRWRQDGPALPQAQVDHIAREDGVLPETDDEDDVQDDATVAEDA